MASMRTLRRRLLRWDRYIKRYPDCGRLPRGFHRAAQALGEKREYRREQRFADYEDRCCTRDPGHEGPCAWFCSWCSGDGGCPGCDGWDDLGCEECGGGLVCQYCGGAGEFVEDVSVGPRVVTEHAFQEAGLL